MIELGRLFFIRRLVGVKVSLHGRPASSLSKVIALVSTVKCLRPLLRRAAALLIWSEYRLALSLLSNSHDRHFSEDLVVRRLLQLLEKVFFAE